ncbi:MAG TPA: M13-type metalloendopeptidase [Steroidobacteraceae bacterium]|nr:M13-type metalloendopeptidase [Steroidobacteraceae bacterium]
MNKLIVGSLSAMLAACAAQSPKSPEPAGAAGPPPAAARPPSGLDLAGFDRSVRPQDDLYRFTGGGWLAKTDIPADRATFGTFELLEVQAEERTRRIIEDAAREPNRAPGSDARKIGDFYTSFMDTAHLEQAGIEPLKAELARIDALRTPRDVAAHIGYAQRIGVNHPFVWFVGQDGRDATQYLANLYQTGLTMPDRDYYLKPDKRYQELRTALGAYVGDMLSLAGGVDATEAAKHVVALETKLAEAHWTKVKNRDPVATYNRMDKAEVAKLAPGFDWAAFNGAAGIPGDVTDVNQPSYIAAVAQVVSGEPAAHWREYFRFHLLDEYAPFLSQAFVDRQFDFRQRTIKGVQEQKPRWKRAVDTMDSLVGEMVGKLYVEKHFSPEAKQRVRTLVDNLLRSFDASIDGLDWMSPATKLEAKRKVASFTVKIGYPDKWRDYSTLAISPNDLAGNVLRAATYEHQRNVAKLGKPLDRTEWLMPPQQVNAYYYPPMNEIVFPAAILEPPFFNVAADDAVNYGGIGSVIGHEISHGFDDSGRQFDGAGNLRDWWQREDTEKFKEKAARLVAQYGSYTVLDGQKLNGELTIGENIGDLSGSAVAYKAYRLSLGGREAAVIDAFTGPQRFFLGYAQIWRRKYREQEQRMRLLTDPHSPAEFRANGVVTNMNEFYDAFGLKPGDGLYRAPQERVKIW